MAQPSYSTSRPNPAPVSQGFAEGFVFGIPMGGLGWFASLLIAFSVAFAMFFLGTFLGIVGIMVANSGGHAAYDYAWSYSRVGLPFGAVAGVISLSYLGYLWVRRQITRR